MSTSHFGEWVSACVDGQLTAPQAERLLMHTAQCGQCAEELAAERYASSALLSAADAQPSTDLTKRLLLVAQAEAMGPSQGAPRRTRPDELRPGGQRPFPALTGEVARRPRTRLVVAGTVAVAAALGGLMALGAPTMIIPELDQARALSVLAGQEGEPRAVQITADQTAPSMVRHQPGMLHTSHLEGLEGVASEQVAGTRVFVLSQSPLHIVWQSGDTVVDLVSPSSLPEVAGTIESYPNEPFATGPGHRIGRGWAELSRIWSNR